MLIFTFYYTLSSERTADSVYLPMSRCLSRHPIETGMSTAECHVMCAEKPILVGSRRVI